MNRIAALSLAGLAWLLLAVGCHPAEPANTELVNGDFESSFTDGWLQESDPDGAVPVWERTDTLGQPDSGFAAQVTIDGQGYGRLRQVLLVNNEHYGFAFNARLRLGGSLSCTPIASVILSYLDSDGRTLGSTRWYQPGLYCDWTNTSTCHLIEVPSDAWRHHYVNLGEELDWHLHGIRSSDVARVQIEVRAEVASSG